MVAGNSMVQWIICDLLLVLLINDVLPCVVLFAVYSYLGRSER